MRGEACIRFQMVYFTYIGIEVEGLERERKIVHTPMSCTRFFEGSESKGKQVVRVESVCV